MDKCKNYSFPEALEGDTMDPNRLSLEEQRIYGEVLGLLWDMAATPRDGRKKIEAFSWDARQLDFISGNLGSDDFICRKKKGDGYNEQRYRVTIANPLITYYTRNPFPETGIGPTIQDSILSGALTNICLRKNIPTEEKTPKHDRRRLMHVTKNNVVTSQLRDFAKLRKMTMLNLDFPLVRGRAGNGVQKKYDCYSIWFLDPAEVSRYLIPEFGLSEEMGRFQNYNTPEGSWIAIRQLNNFDRGKTYDRMKYEGKLSIGEYKELINQGRILEKKLDNVEQLLAEGKLDRKRSEELCFEYETLLSKIDEMRNSGKKPPSGRWRRKKNLDSFRAREGR